MRSEEDIMKKLSAITERKDYWRTRLRESVPETESRDKYYQFYRYWAAQEAALKYVVGLQDSLTIQN